MRIFFVSDHHFGHVNILKPTYCNRPFKDVEHMNEMLVQNHNSVVAADDIVIIGGDCLMGNIEDSFKWFTRLNGILCLTDGNHDEKALTREWFRNRFEWIKPNHEMKATLPSGKEITLIVRHYPLRYDDQTGKITEALPANTFLCHGHSHGKIPFNPAVPQLDIGVDGPAQYFPMEFTKVLEFAQQHFDWLTNNP